MIGTMVAFCPTPSSWSRCSYALDLVDAVLPVAEQVQPLRPAFQELAAELGPDAPTRAGDQHPLSPHVGEAGTEVHPDRGCARGNPRMISRAWMRCASPSRIWAIPGRPDPGEPRPAQDREYPRELLTRGAGNGDDRLVGGSGLDHLGRRIDRPEHGDAVDAPADLPGSSSRKATTCPKILFARISAAMVVP